MEISEVQFYSVFRWFVVGINALFLLGFLSECTVLPWAILDPRTVLSFVLSAVTVYVLWTCRSKGALRIICIFLWWASLLADIYMLISAAPKSFVVYWVVGIGAALRPSINLLALYKLPLLSTGPTGTIADAQN
ncbi:MAG: hypothetical protein PVH24_01160 [Candidatus Zixiibacteriota bacterium]